MINRRRGSWRLALPLVALLTSLGSLFAQAPPEPAGGDAAPADLVLANRLVMTFRTPNLSVSPAGRAEAAAARIKAVLRRGAVGKLDWVDTSEGILIRAGGEGLFRIAPGDVNAEAGETPNDYREKVVSALSTALREEQEARNVASLATGAARSALAAVIYLAALWILRRATAWLRRKLLEAAHSRVGSLVVGGFTLLSEEQAAGALGKLIALLRLLIVFGLTYVGLTFVLQQLPYTRPWGEQLGGYLGAMAGAALTEILSAVPGLVVVAAILFAARFLSGLVSAFFTAVEAGSVAVELVHPDTAKATRRISQVVLWLFAIAVAYPYLPGSDSPAFQGIGVLAGLMLSLGSTNAVGQLMSGFVLIYARSFRPGDYVRIGEYEGTVEQLGLFVTRLRTNKLELVSIPHQIVLNGETKNYTRSAEQKGLILYTSVTIGYDAPWRLIHRLLIEAALKTPGLLREPPPFVYQTALSDFYVEYQVNARIERPEARIRVLAELHANIQDAFNEAGVQIMSPHYEADPASPKVVPKEGWNGARS